MTYAYDDVTYVYDDVTYVYDDVTYVYDDVTSAGLHPCATCMEGGWGGRGVADDALFDLV